MITQAEWKIMEIVWANPRIDALTIHKNLDTSLKWSISTVKTLISRLVKKNCLNIEKIGKTFFYSANLNKDDIIYQKIDSIFDLVCNTKQAELIRYILEISKMNKSDIRNIITKLQNLELTAPDIIKCNCNKGQCLCKPLMKNNESNN
ncbi:BlaI/MecI/CopY family transcriptional regulator [Gemella sp. GH3]|uniref:BlaI/MecI/CopY family transcriptional regulator n=1 Tax=unclassified Gemella TaxID=2624949 RepID=UPI0015D0633F|nr:MULTISPECIES: BlaI/MecI/CopY family transcriptional regulator [unclassified Gemella]MBF0713276.1 BlaI/MecI/CopY family transcriptional regulator [Gemella sp. GH3.1]NYS50228.1 BlaI/MecI/CopY family transcriptional regulator [Gemella sp. GH3]